MGAEGNFAKLTAGSRLSQDLARVQGHAYDGVHSERVEAVDFSLRRDAAGDDQPPRSSFPDRTHGLQRNSAHQAFRINVGIEEGVAERFECPNHVERGEGSTFAPAVDRNSSASGIESKDQG